MSKLRVFYIVSLVILGVLLVFTVFKPMATGGEYSEVQRAQLLEKENGWIIEFDIINHEGKDTNYLIEVLVDGKSYTEKVLIPEDRMFTYIHHIYRARLSEGKVCFVIYKEAEDTPFEEVTYHLK